MKYYLNYDATTGLIIGAPYCDLVHGKQVPVYNTEQITKQVPEIDANGRQVADKEGKPVMKSVTQAAGTVQTGTTLDLSAIPTPNIELTEAEHDDWMQHQSTRKVDVTAKKLVEYTPAPVVLTAVQRLTALDAEYQRQFTAVTQAYLTAMTAGDATTAAARQADYATLKANYKTALGAI
ncbi:MAG: hypothetical protein ABFC84_02510 [Veillonellales bacterium]